MNKIQYRRVRKVLVVFVGCVVLCLSTTRCLVSQVPEQQVLYAEAKPNGVVSTSFELTNDKSVELEFWNAPEWIESEVFDGNMRLDPGETKEIHLALRCPDQEVELVASIFIQSIPAGEVNKEIVIHLTCSHEARDSNVDRESLLFPLLPPALRPPPGNDTNLPVIKSKVGSRLIDITGCTNTLGHSPAVAGNIVAPVASSPTSTDAYLTFTAVNRDILSVKISENSQCSSVKKINDHEDDGHSHNQPSVVIDGDGNHQYLYHGKSVYRETERTRSGPYTRRVLASGTFWPESRSRLWTPSETHGFRMRDGAIFTAGSDHDARIDIIEKDGSYRWPHSRQVVRSDSTPLSQHICKSNRFTKAVFTQGEDSRIHVTWGFGTGFSDNSDCPNMQHYRDDSMQVYYAFSEDGGVTWKNAGRTKSTEASYCPDTNCGSGGIMYNDPAYVITNTRQRQKRGLVVDARGNVKLGFTKSTWCDSGVCTSRNVTRPGALMLLEFNLNDPSDKKETVVHSDNHTYFSGMRAGDGGLYFFALTDNDAMEYHYKDGTTTSRLIRSGCIRMASELPVPNQNTSRLVMECFGGTTRGGDKYRSVWFYERAY